MPHPGDSGLRGSYQNSAQACSGVDMLTCLATLHISMVCLRMHQASHIHTVNTQLIKMKGNRSMSMTHSATQSLFSIWDARRSSTGM